MFQRLTCYGECEEEKKSDTGVKPCFSIGLVGSDIACDASDVQCRGSTMLGSLPNFNVDRVSGIVCLGLWLEAHWLAFQYFVTGEGLLVFGDDFDLGGDGVGKGRFIPWVEEAVELTTFLVDDSSSHNIDDER